MCGSAGGFLSHSPGVIQAGVLCLLMQDSCDLIWVSVAFSLRIMEVARMRKNQAWKINHEIAVHTFRTCSPDCLLLQYYVIICSTMPIIYRMCNYINVITIL